MKKEKDELIDLIDNSLIDDNKEDRLKSHLNVVKTIVQYNQKSSEFKK